MNIKREQLIDLLLSVVLGVAGFFLYFHTLSIGPFPGSSARLIAEVADLFPRLTPNHPLWSGVVWMLAKLPVGALSVRLNIFSALCGAFSLSLLYGVVATTVRSTIDEGNRDILVSRVAAIIAGISAVLFFAFCVPFWSACNRVSTASFDILLLLSITRVFMLYAVSGKIRHALVFAFFYGVCTVEVPALIVLSPVFGLYLMVLMWRNEELSLRPIVSVVLCSFVGLLFYFLVAWLFCGSEGYGLRGYANYWQVIWYLWRDQYWAITRTMPRQGWLIVLVLTVVPWLTCISIAKRGLNSEKDWSYYALHAVMTALVVCVLFDVEWLQKLLKGGIVPVTPYLLTALVYGYLIAYWFLLPMNWHSHRSDGRSRGATGSWLGLGIAIPGLALLLYVPFKNIERTDARSSEAVNKYAEMVVDNLDGHTWLVTNGSIDDNLSIAAQNKGIPLNLINLRAGKSSIYLKYLSDSLPNIRLKNALDMGIMPMLQEWIEIDSHIEDILAMLAGQDILISSGMTLVPNKMLFFATKEPEKIDFDALLVLHEKFWKEILQMFDADTEDMTGSGFASRHVSMVANNLGVLMEDQGRNKDAFKCYIWARELYSDNVSALLNQSAMITNGFESDRAAAIDADLKKMLDQKERYPVWMLSRFFGYVRSPDVFLRMGWAWARSGQPKLAGEQVKKAMELLPADKTKGLKQVLAGLYVDQDRDEEGEALFFELLIEDPNNVRALMGAAQVAIRKGAVDDAKKLLDRAKQAGVSSAAVDLELSALYLMTGKNDEGKKLLRAIVKRHPKVVRAWSMLGAIAILEQDKDVVAECIRVLASLDRTRFLASLMSAQFAFSQKDYTTAVRYFELAFRAKPGSIDILEKILKIDLMIGDKASAGKHVKTLLALDRKNAVGNHLMAALYIQDGKNELAMISLRRSLATKRTPESLNDLAWILMETGAFVEAEKLAREAIEKNVNMYNAWDTLGAILMKTGRIDEAEQAIEHALSLFQGDMCVYVNMAELLILKGEKIRAKEILDMLAERRTNLSAEDLRKMERLNDEI